MTNRRTTTKIWTISIAAICALVVSQAWFIYQAFADEAQRHFDATMQRIAATLEDTDNKLSSTPIGGVSFALWTDITPDTIAELRSITFTHTRVIDRHTTASSTDTLRLTRPTTALLDWLTSRYSIAMSQNISLQHIDTLLAANAATVSELSIDTAPAPVLADTYTTSYTWSDSRMHFSYALNPVKGTVLKGTVHTPVSLYTKQTRIALLLSFCIIAIIALCLAYQIRAIQWQMRLSEMRSNMIATLVHELRRPVQSLKTFVSFLANKEMRLDEELTQQVVSDSKFELDNLTAYLDRTREMARGTLTHTPLNIKLFDINALIERIVRLTQTPLGKQADISTNLCGTELMLLADPIHIANCIRNLIENSLKYSGEAVSIGISTAIDSERCYITVADNGWGILPSEKNIVFEPFTRSPRFNRREIPGLGLGLSYIKHIAQMHGGAVRINDVPCGTSVTLSLPL